MLNRRQPTPGIGITIRLSTYADASAAAFVVQTHGGPCVYTFQPWKDFACAQTGRRSADGTFGPLIGAPGIGNMFGMKMRITLGLLLLLAVTGTGRAQSYPSYEIFGGYSLSHQQGEANLNGWNAQAAFNLTRSLSIAADVSANYMGSGGSFNGIADLADARVYSYSLGPRAYNRSFENVSIYSQVLFGASRVVGQADLGGGITERRIYRPFTMTIGAGVDVALKDRLWLRVVELDYRLLRINSMSSNGLRVSTGVNFTF